MAAEKLIARLEQLGLIDESLIRRLRKQVSEAKNPVSAKAIAKVLIDRGELTPAQAKKLLAEVEPESGESKPAAKPEAKKESASAAGVSKKPAPPVKKSPPPSEANDLVPLDDAMGLTPLDENAGLTPIDDGAGLTPIDDSPGLSPIDDSAGLTPLDDAGGLTPLDDSDGLTPLDDAGGLTPLEESAGLMPLDGSADAFGSDLGGNNLNAGASDADNAFGYGAASSSPTAKPTIKKIKQRGWDSPLILLGGGALLLLLIAGAALLYSLTRGTASQLFETAEGLYRSESYDQAIAAYDKFLKDFPKDPHVSEVKVRRGTARLRIAVDVSKDMRMALELSQKLIPEIEKESAFEKCRDELVAMLPKIAEAFANAAKSAQTGAKAEEWVGLADQAMELVNNPSYIPTTHRESQQTRFDAIKRMIELAKRTIAQDKALVRSVTEMQAAVDAGNTVAAFDIRKKLLKEYPGVEHESSLVEVVRKVAAKERDLVRTESQVVSASTEEPASSVRVLRLVPSHRKGNEATELAGQILFVLARGSVFGLDATNGKVLWRRAVGSETLYYPGTIGKEAGADALVSDGRRNELLRLKAQTGALVWRLAIGEPFAAPVSANDKLFVTTRSGKVLEVDPETGKSERQAALPQPTTVSSGSDGRSPILYQVGSHSNIYALAADSLACQDVFYLGHKDGTVHVPPVLVLKHLVVAENAGADHCLLRVLATDENGLGLRETQEKPIRIVGNVTSPLLPFKNRVIVVSDLGEVKVLEIDPEQKTDPAKVVAEQVRTVDIPQLGFSLADANTVWIANNRLAAFDIQTARGQLSSKWSQHDEEMFVAPLQRVGNVLIHTRRRRGSSGVTVSAVRADKGSPLWRTDLAVPNSVTIPDSTPGQLIAINSHGDLFRFSAKAFQGGLIEKPELAVEPDGSEVAFEFTDPAILDGSRVALSSRTDRGQLMVMDPSKTRLATLTRLDLGNRVPVQAGVAFNGSLLVPFDAGFVGLFHPDNGKPRLLPFQPRLEPGKKTQWFSPVVVGAQKQEFVIVDDNRKMFRVAIRETPEPHLAAVGQLELTAVPIAPIVATQDNCFCVTRGPAGNDILLPITLPGLKLESEVTLSGRLTAGPWSANNLAVLVTDKDGIVCFGAGGKRMWAAALEHGPLAGPPLADGNSLLFASRSGFVWRTAMDSGQKQSEVETGEMIRGSVVAFGKALLLTANDGTLLAIPNLPQP